MDVNGTRFHLLLGARDWRSRLEASSAAPDERPMWDARRGRLTLRRELFRFPPRPSETPFAADDRRGAGRDRFGHFYWISADRRAIRYRPRDDSSSAVLWSVEALAGVKEQPAKSPGAFVACQPPPLPALPLLSGLAVTERHFLVVGTLQPAGLLVFDLYGGGPPVWMRWPDEVPFAPFDLAPTPDGGVWVLDRPGAGSASRLWRLDRDLRVVRAGDDIAIGPPAMPDAFHPVDPVPPPDCTGPLQAFPGGIALALASPPVPADGDARAVVSLPDGTALVMESDPAEGDTLIHRWTLCAWTGGSPAGAMPGTLGAPASLALALTELLNEPASLVGYDMAFVADDSPGPGLLAGRLWVADAEGNQSIAFALSTGLRGTAESAALDITALAAYFPMRQWAGKALIAGGGDAYYDLADGWLPLTELPRPRFATRGVLDGIVFDGKEPGCIWHRLMIDACIPPGDAVDIESRAADTPEDLEGVPFRLEPALRLRPGDSELPWTRAFPDGEAGAPGVGTWELLFQAAAGRFIELRLTLRGSGRSSPKLRALRAYYPRFSYLRYLPDAYRDDLASASLLDRFFANFEGVLTELEGRIEAAQVLFDRDTAPPETLDWLASWLGAALDERWDETRRRLFIANAVELYSRRGTRRGLLAALRLSLDPCPAGELFADDTTRGPFGFRLSEGFRAGDAGAAHRFTVLTPVGLSASPAERLQLRDSVAAVVERERPAHAAFDVQLYWGLFRVGAARVGQDTALGEGSRLSALVLGSSYLGMSLLTEDAPFDVRDRRVAGRDRTGFPPPLA